MFESERMLYSGALTEDVGFVNIKIETTIFFKDGLQYWHDLKRLMKWTYDIFVCFCLLFYIFIFEQ